MSEKFEPTDGVYHVTVTNCETRSREDGSQYIFVGYQITEGDNAGRYINDFLSLDTDKLAWTRAMLVALNWDGSNSSFDSVIGYSTTVNVKVKAKASGVGVYVNIYPSNFVSPVRKESSTKKVDPRAAIAKLNIGHQNDVAVSTNIPF